MSEKQNQQQQEGAEVNQSFEDTEQSPTQAEPVQADGDANEAQEPVGGEDKGVENPEPADPNAQQHQE